MQCCYSGLKYCHDDKSSQLGLYRYSYIRPPGDQGVKGAITCQALLQVLPLPQGQPSKPRAPKRVA
jgi:hypothetical protein